MKAVRSFSNTQKTSTVTVGAENESDKSTTSVDHTKNNETSVSNTNADTTDATTNTTSNDTKPPNTFFNVIERANGAAVENANIWAS